MFEQNLSNILGQLEQDGLKRELRDTQSAQGSRIQFEGREVLNFCSNNYLGLANDSRLGQSIVESIQTEGFGSAASRLVCGNMPSHCALEEWMAKFKGTEASLMYSSGYMANVGIISSLFGKDDIIFSDRLNHASIIDGIRLSGATLKRYRHLDMEHLEQLLESTSGLRHRCIITDSVFSMDGDVAPLDKIVELSGHYDCQVMIDEAHAFGVMGDLGQGCAHHFGVQDRIDIQMGTFSKAAGSFGAYVCTTKLIRDFLVNRSRSFIYTTGLPPLIAAASLKAGKIIEEDQSLRNKLWDNTYYMRAGLRLAGFDTLRSSTPIIPVLIPDSQVCVEFSKRLFDQGILVSAIRPPTVPKGTSRLRLTVMAPHTKTDLDLTLNRFQSIGKELGVI